jgi:hypothetical protein
MTIALRSRYRAFRWGLYYRHPLCCVIRYCLSHYPPGVRRGAKVTDKAGLFVPRGVFHHHDADMPPDGPSHPGWREDAWRDPEPKYES